jgi:UDP-2,3-diacylglucosamine pyrophosphatase LpxH
MVVFIFCDLHVGHAQANYTAIGQAIALAAQEADEIWGLGDWFDLTEEGLDRIRRHEFTGKLIDLAGQKPTRLIPGNHDIELYEYAHHFAPITICDSFVEDNIYYSHGHEYDPVSFLPHWWHQLWARLTRKRTPGVLRGEGLTSTYLTAIGYIHARALLDAIEKGRKGLVMGHTHFPFEQRSPEAPFIINGGDMRDSATFVKKDGDRFEIVRLQDS